MKLQEFSDYLKYQKRYSPLTIKAYMSDLEITFEYLSDTLGIEDFSIVKHNHLRSFIVSLMQHGLSEKSINRKISALRTYSKFLRRKGLIQQDPCLNLIAPKIPKRLPNHLKANEVENILHGITIDQTAFSEVRDLMIVYLLVSLGLRRAELIDIKLSDIDFISKNIAITGKGNKQRRLPLSVHVINKIMLYLDLRKTVDGVTTNHLLITDKGKPLYPKFVYNTVLALLEGNTVLKKKSPHVLRHTFATILSENGAEINAVKGLLGHSSLAATQIYTHSSIVAIKNAYHKAHPRS